MSKIFELPATIEAAFESHFSYPIEQASDCDYGRAEDNVTDATQCALLSAEEVQRLNKAGFDDLVLRLLRLESSVMAFDCAKNHL